MGKNIYKFKGEIVPEQTYAKNILEFIKNLFICELQQSGLKLIKEEYNYDTLDDDMILNFMESVNSLYVHVTINCMTCDPYEFRYMFIEFNMINEDKRTDYKFNLKDTLVHNKPEELIEEQIKNDIRYFFDKRNNVEFK